MKIYNVLKNLTRNKIQISRLNGYQTLYLSSAGTGTIQLLKSCVYLVAVARLNSANSSYQGLYFVQSHTQSNIIPIITNAAATLSMNSDALLTVTTTQNYCNIIVIPIMDI